MFQVNFGACSGAFGVPNEVVDTHLKLSGALSLKVLLVLLRHGRAMSLKELAEFLNQSEGDIRDALAPWLENGMIYQVDTEPIVQSTPQPVAKTVTTVSASKNTKEKDTSKTIPTVKMERFRRMNRHDVNEIAQQDGTVGVIIEEAQNVLCRPLSNGESEMLISFYHYYGMAADILLMLLTYCKTVGKDNAGYIEKMASDWVNKEINTHERAEKELLRLTEKLEDENKMRHIFGVYDRGFTPKEIEYYQTWVNEYKFDERMIRLANEKTIDSKGKLSFPYTNAILKAWFDKGIKNPDQAEQEGRGNQNGANKNQTSEGQSSASYDLGSLDDMITHGSIWD